MAAGDLTDLASVRRFLQKQGADTAQDDVIRAFITAASRAIMRHVQREFAPPTSSPQEREFVYRGGRRLSLAPYDVREIHELVMDSDQENPLLIDETRYQLRPKPAEDGVYQWVRFIGDHTHYHTGAMPAVEIEREVTILGDWGFEAVPSDVANWCVVQVADWVRRDVSAFGTSFQIDEGRLERPEALISAVKGGLAHYHRDPQAG